MIRYLPISLFLCLLIQCTGSTSVLNKTNDLNSNKATHLYGEISPEELYEVFPAWEKIEDDYQVDKNAIKSLAQVGENYRVDIFLGTWCSDSRREAPRFMKIWERAGLNNIVPMTLYAVDRNKESGNGLAKDRDIQFVPTFIFYKGDQEVGRIIESPDDLLEKDVAQILLTE